MNELRKRLDTLYNGHGPGPTRFRYWLLAFDFLVVVFFVASSMFHDARWIVYVDVVLAVPLLADYLIRFWIARQRIHFLIDPIMLADLVVIVTMLAAAFVENLAFLRVVRALRLLRSHHVLRELRENYAFFARNEEVIQSVINLVVFIFTMTALVFVLQVNVNPKINDYLDALYFTVTTLTTTGFGDITLEGSTGRFLAVGIMVIGVALFLRLVQTIFRPTKVRYTCPDCGLSRHDPDAVHCKHCGRVIRIETEGEV